MYYIQYNTIKKGSFDSLSDISDHMTLLQLTDSIGNANHAVSMVGKLVLFKIIENFTVIGRIIEPRILIFTWGKIFMLFDTVFYSILSIIPKANNN